MERFFRFPSVKRDRQRREAWIRAVGRQCENGRPWQPSAASRLCGKHFVSDGRGKRQKGTRLHRGHVSSARAILPNVARALSEIGPFAECLQAVCASTLPPPGPTAEEAKTMSGDHRTVINGSPSQYVKLNVGGSLHYTTIGTLTKHDSMLRAMFSGRMEVLTDSEGECWPRSPPPCCPVGRPCACIVCHSHRDPLTSSHQAALGWILIDRCGKHFGTILNFLRDGSVPLPESTREIAELLAEAKYYLIQALVESCEAALQKKESSQEPICRVPLITNEKEGNLLISTSTKPLVKLLINRHNNKYSYTSTSDDNLLKNVEMFDRLSLRFCSRVLFIKDVIGSNEICCWTFYGTRQESR
ncbi:hypothetical protein HPB48_018747 [Haemaphysalis longicornis]|uniref:THAP-type domain-containing protein n=1 Tax=Haemaphysalis longicornis TaxID=44386 RepID=A0A9J6GNN6_HAELO|nr:hypothetical protein HPB48_018747 [Haemaphysalis longicornis]